MTRAAWAWMVGGALLLSAALVGACSSDEDADGQATEDTSSASSGSCTGGHGGSFGFTCEDAGADANDQPPTVEILEPMEGAVYKTGETIPLKGAVTDVLDGPIESEQQVLWFKDMVDPTGEGLEDSVDPCEDGEFAPGMHTITLTAVNSRCLTGSQTVSIVVE